MSLGRVGPELWIAGRFGAAGTQSHDRPVAALSRATPTLQRIVLPAGAKVVATDVADGRLVARIELPGGGVRVLVVDLASGRPVATIDLAPPSP